MRSLFVTMLLGALLGSSDGGDHVSFTAKVVGTVDVTTTFPIGGFPTANFRSSSGALLHSVAMGQAEPGLFRIDPPDPDLRPDLAYLGPTVVSYFVLSATQAHDNTVLAVAKYSGGSDCAYASSIVGATAGHLKTWFQQSDIVNSQGGVYAGDLGGSRGFGVAAWTDLWEDGGHYSAHRYRLWLYRIDLQSGTSQLIFDRSTKRKYASKDALKEFGVQYKNFLKDNEALGC